MQEIVDSIKNVADIMSEITAASQEQNSGIGQVNQSVVQMDEVTQQNAALVEEAAASTESLENMAKELNGAISIFNVGQSASTQEKASVLRMKHMQPKAHRPMAQKKVANSHH